MTNPFEDSTRLMQTIIGQSPPGWYTLSELLHSIWDDVGLKNSFGRAFKSLVEDGALFGICVGDKTVTNHQLYWIG